VQRADFGDISTTPELKTEDGNIDINAQKDVRFRRVVNNDVRPYLPLIAVGMI